MNAIINNFPEPKISRQAQKILDLIRNPKTTQILRRDAVMLLEQLGYICSTKGAHQTWRHPSGVRFLMVWKKHEEHFWGWSLKLLRESFHQLGLMPVEIAYDSEVIVESPKEKEIEAMSLTPEQSQQLRVLKEYVVAQDVKINGLNDRLGAIENLLLDLGVKIDSLQTGKPKESKVSALKKKIEKAIADHPEDENNYRVIAAYAETTVAKVRSYFAGELA